MLNRNVVLGLLAGAVAPLMTAGFATPALAQPVWKIDSFAPTYLTPGKVGAYEVSATNVGDAAAAGEAKLIVKLAPGQEYRSLALDSAPIDEFFKIEPFFNLGFFCSSAGQEVVCTLPEFAIALGGQPGDSFRVEVQFTTSPSASEGPVVDEALVEGGGATSVSTASQSTVSSHPQFSVTKFTLQTTKTSEVLNPANQQKEPLSRTNWGFESEPAPFTQAGGHPNGQAGGADSLTSTIEFATEDVLEGSGQVKPVPTRDPRDISVTLPPGLLGNPTAVKECPLKQALNFELCPPDTQVGVATIYLDHGEGLVGPIVNVTPETGQSAEFAIENNHNISFVLTGHVVRTSEGYGLNVVTNSIPMNEIYRVETSFWGVPAAASHDPERGLLCGREAKFTQPWKCEVNNKPTGGEKAGEEPVPFITMPTDCAVGADSASLQADSWEEPVHYDGTRLVEGEYAPASHTMPGVTGCNLLQFAPGIDVEPDTLTADAPVGLGVTLAVPQFEKPERLSTPEVRSATVTLPPGMSISPGAVDGIQACNESGPDGINLMGPESEEVGANGELQLAPGHCPDASILGTAEAVTPLLASPLKGHIYLARPGCGNAGLGQHACTEQDALDGNLYKLYLELGGTGVLASTGVHVKVPGEIQANPATGQLTTRFEGFEVGDPPHFEGNPQLPFSELKVQLNGGPQASLDNPATCGQATTTADIDPWAFPGRIDNALDPNNGLLMPGLPDATPSSYFSVEGCAAPPDIVPGFTAGTVTANAAKFSAFTLNISRKDREQYIKGVQVHTPPGLLGMLSNVPLCEEPNAENGTCPAASKIGTVRVASGAGSHPFEIEGTVYLTGPYEGAPFGLSIATPAVAGPFNLGLVVVRSRIDVNPHDSTLTVTTDEKGPRALPQIWMGVPLRLKRITVNIDRPSFMFNPTSCEAKQITARISGSQEAVGSVSSPFAVGGCASLAFKPVFKAVTNGHTSRKLGASLDARLSYPKGAMGKDANIARVKVSLPKQLPSYLSTLQKACPVQTFEADPAKCSKASIVGVARTSTPVLPVPLTGPVYFVSHGGEAFPQLVVVLQGDGVRVDLVGSTFIKKGITSSTFKAVPDVPVNTFELYLPQRKDHALAANGNLCKAQAQDKLVMPTEFVAQSGAVIHQKTKIAVTGCGRAKAAHRKRRRGARVAPHDNGSKGRR